MYLKMDINKSSVTNDTMLTKALAVTALTASLLTIATVTALQPEVFAPRSRRWTPSEGDVITLEGGVVTSQMNPEYPIEFFSCTVIENTAVAGVSTWSCNTYE